MRPSPGALEAVFGLSISPLRRGDKGPIIFLLEPQVYLPSANYFTENGPRRVRRLSAASDGFQVPVRPASKAVGRHVDKLINFFTDLSFVNDFKDSLGARHERYH